MLELVWTPQAERDLTEIFDFIARDSLDYAETTVMNIYDRAEQLQHFPQSGRRVPELKRSRLREIIAQ
ncbi:MAG: type II toxin-antitoxin system RelE/ParE family toxin [Rhizobacter sp.]|nr:type II toxin-antitoxin system RelE/ParE family toxin [Chlorobiales bacterium]